MGNENGRKAKKKKKKEFLKAVEEINYNKKGIFVWTKLT